MRARKTVRKLSGDALFDYAVKYLGIRACSTDELKFKLRGKAADLSEIDGAIERLKNIGYLNDERFAESFASYRLENEGFGRMRVLSDLRSRRVPAKMAETAVEQIFEGKDEPALVDAYIERRMPSLASCKVEDEKKIASAYRRLRRAGFSSGNVLAAMKRIAKRPELLEEAPPEDETDLE